MLSDDGREITLYRLTDGDACVLAAACVIRQITFEVQLVADAPTELLIPARTCSAAHGREYPRRVLHVPPCDRALSDVMWAMQQLLFTGFDKRLAQYLWDETDHARAPVRATHEQIARDGLRARDRHAHAAPLRRRRHRLARPRHGHVADAEKLRRLAGM